MWEQQKQQQQQRGQGEPSRQRERQQARKQASKGSCNCCSQSARRKGVGARRGVRRNVGTALQVDMPLLNLLLLGRCFLTLPAAAVVAARSPASARRPPAAAPCPLLLLRCCPRCCCHRWRHRLPLARAADPQAWQPSVQPLQQYARLAQLNRGGERGGVEGAHSCTTCRQPVCLTPRHPIPHMHQPPTAARACLLVLTSWLEM